MSSAVRYREHGNPHSHIVGWLVVYEAATPGIETGDNSTLRLDLDNEPQPDILLRIDSELGGGSWIDENGYLEGSPELVAEVAASSVSYDLHEKLSAYRRNGIREYVVWRVGDRAIDWFILRKGEYVRQEPDATGLCRSEAFPGLWLEPTALIRGDMSTVLQRLREGLASQEHTEFVARLQRAGKETQSPK